MGNRKTPQEYDRPFRFNDGVMTERSGFAMPTPRGMTDSGGRMVEQVIEELKNIFSATGIRTNNFWANDALFLTGLIADNLLDCICRPM